MSSTEFGPSVLFSFNDHIADYTWLRPYIGAGLNFYRSSIASPVLGDMSDSRYGSQLFGGGELSFASVPQFAISTQVSYRWLSEPAIGYDLGGVGVSLAGHGSPNNRQTPNSHSNLQPTLGSWELEIGVDLVRDHWDFLMLPCETTSHQTHARPRCRRSRRA